MTKQERDALIQQYHELSDELLQLIRSKENRDRQRELKEERKQVKQAYFDGLPRIAISRCPFTQEPLIRAFDPWGIDGFWWQEQELRSYEEPPAPGSFCVLTGAVNLNGLAPFGGRSKAHVGSDVPYIISRILAMPTMVAVVSSIRLENGYTAFPIAYYAEESPPVGSLTQTWRCTSYSFVDENGLGGWYVATDPWDFDLESWVEQGKVKWIVPGDEELLVRGGTWDDYPFKHLEGLREQIVIENGNLWASAPPQNEEVEPFE